MTQECMKNQHMHGIVGQAHSVYSVVIAVAIAIAICLHLIQRYWRFIATVAI